MRKKHIREFNEQASWLKKGIVYHRGKHDSEIKENSLTAIKRAVDDNLAIECDVRLTKDEKVVVSHDDSLKRVFGVDKLISECTYEEVYEYSKGEVPLFSEVLSLVNGKIGIMVEIKSTKNRKLKKFVYDILKEYKGKYVVVSFDPFILGYFKRKDSSIIRGQISYSYYDSKYPGIVRFLLSRLLLNFISKPHFISYGIDRCNLKVLDKFRKKGYFIIGWTYRDETNKETLSSVYDNMIVENLSIREF